MEVSGKKRSRVKGHVGWMAGAVFHFTSLHFAFHSNYFPACRTIRFHDFAESFLVS